MPWRQYVSHTSFDELNREEGMHEQKIKLSEQLFHHSEQQPQGFFKFWHCFHNLRGDVSVIIQSIRAAETAET